MKNCETTSVAPFKAEGTDGESNWEMTGYQVVNIHTNCRLTFVSDPTGETCCVSVTDMDKGEGHHIFLSTDALRTLIGAFSTETETKLEQ